LAYLSKLLDMTQRVWTGGCYLELGPMQGRKFSIGGVNHKHL